MNTATVERRPDSAYDVDCVDRARALVPLLRSNAAETEKNRTIHPDNIDALRGGSVFHRDTASLRGLGA